MPKTFNQQLQKLNV